MSNRGFGGRLIINNKKRAEGRAHPYGGRKRAKKELSLLSYISYLQKKPYLSHYPTTKKYKTNKPISNKSYVLRRCPHCGFYTNIINHMLNKSCNHTEYPTNCEICKTLYKKTLELKGVIIDYENN